MGVETAIMAAGAGMSMLGSIQEGQSAKAWGKYQNKQAKADAAATIGAAKVEQSKIREAVASQVSSAVASTAGSGVVVADGTAKDITSRINSRGEYDAQMTMFNAQDQANRILAEGQAAKLQGQQQEKASYMAAAGSLMGAAGTGFANNWKSGQGSNTNWAVTGMANTPLGKSLSNAGLTSGSSSGSSWFNWG